RVAHFVLALRQILEPLLALRARLVEAGDLLLHVALLLRERVRLALQVADVLAARRALRLLEQALRVVDRLRRALPPPAAVVVAVGGGLARRVRGLLQPPLCVREVLALFALALRVAPQLLELARGRFKFVRQRSLGAAGARSGLLAGAALLFGLLQ